MVCFKKFVISRFLSVLLIIFMSLFFFFSCTHIRSSQKSGALTGDQKPEQDQVRKKPSDFLIMGWNFFKQKKLNEARIWLEKLNYGDEGFISSILEIQKINYIQKDWTRFFGLAVYYRKKLLSSDETSIKNFRQEMLALEILALIRHCRFPEALKIIEWSLGLAEKIKKDSSKISKTVYFFKLKKQVDGIKTKKTDWGKQIHLWPVNSDRIKWLSNPKNLRMKVKSQC